MLLSVCVLLSLSATVVLAKPFHEFDFNLVDENVGEPPATVTKIDLPNYLGRWYQMYADLLVIATFERNNVCVTADYGLNLDGTVSVENNARLGAPDSDNSTNITGFVYIPDPNEPGKLAVVFPSVPGPPGEYWIIKLGPIEESYPSVPLYQYAIVTDSRRTTLFVLARDPVDFKARFKDEVLKFLEYEGFTRFYNSPIATVQTPQCIYAGVKSALPKPTNPKPYRMEQEELKRILFH